MDPPVGAVEGDHPGEAPGEQPQQVVEEVAIEGLGSQLTLDVGGETPTKATVKLKGRSIGVGGGQFEKGKTVKAVVLLRCDAVELIDKRDSQTGEVTETERRHKMTVTSLERLD